MTIDYLQGTFVVALAATGAVGGDEGRAITFLMAIGGERAWRWRGGKQGDVEEENVVVVIPVIIAGTESDKDASEDD